MLTLLSQVTTRRLLLREAPPMAGALLIADRFYTWHSFLLEAGGFMLTWLAIDLVVSQLERRMHRPASTPV